jgi:hypothetical protein
VPCFEDSRGCMHVEFISACIHPRVEHEKMHVHAQVVLNFRVCGPQFSLKTMKNE